MRPADGAGRRVLRAAVIVAGAGALVLAVGAVAVVAAARVSPRPGARMVRRAFDRGAHETARVLAGFAPPEDAVTVREVAYARGRDGHLDVWTPAGAPAVTRPTIVWVHGGGFLAGTRLGTAAWARILAARGWTVVVPDYTLAPRAHYPRQLQQVLDALAFLRRTPPDGVDPDALVLAGDSAGAHLAAQAATVLRHPAYGAAVGVAADPDAAASVRALLLACGPFDVSFARDAFRDGSPRAERWLVRTLGWSYLGRRDFLADERLGTISLVDHVPGPLPPTFVTSGNGDGLTPGGRLYAERLAAAGTEVETLFFPDDYRDPASGEPLGHEYQFDLRLDAAGDALDRMLAFAAAHVEARAGFPVTVRSATRVVDAAADVVFAVLADPALHGNLDASGTVGDAVTEHVLHAVGDVFTMEMTDLDDDGQVVTYRTDNHVTRFEPGRVVEWAVAAPGGPLLGWRWRYEVEPVDDGSTRVRLVYDWTGTSAENVARYGVPLFDEADLSASLDALADHLAGAPRA